MTSRKYLSGNNKFLAKQKKIVSKIDYTLAKQDKFIASTKPLSLQIGNNEVPTEDFPPEDKI